MPTEPIHTNTMVGLLVLLGLGLLIGLGMPIQTTQSYLLDRATRLQARGFHAAERTPDGRGFRWTDGSSYLVFQHGGTGAAILNLILTAPPPTHTPVPVTLVINDHFRTELQLEGTPRRILLLIPPDAHHLSENWVAITSPYVRVADGINPRRLGIVAFSASWTPIPVPHWMLALQVTTLMHVAVLLLLTTRQTPLHLRSIVLIIVLLWLVLLGHLAPTIQARWYALWLTFGSSLWIAGAAIHAHHCTRQILSHGLEGLLWAGALAILIVSLVAGLAPPLLIGWAAVVLLVLRLYHAPTPSRMADLWDWATLNPLRGPRWLGFVALPLLALFLTITLTCSRNECALTTLAGNPVRYDGVGYYVYLPAALIEHDLTFHHRPPDLYVQRHALNRFPATDSYLIKYPIGTALLMLPLFLVGHGVAWLSGQVQDGWSLLYQVPATSTALVMVVLGLGLLERVLTAYVSPLLVRLALTSLLFGTNLLHYTVLDASFSHAYGFGIMATLVYLVPRWYAAPHWRTTMLLGIVSGLLVLIRNTHLIFAMLVLLYGIHRWSDLPARRQWLWQHRLSVILLGMVFCVTITPQLLYWHMITGQWLVNSYQHEGFFTYWRNPNLFGLLLGVERGVFIWFPLLLFSGWGLWLSVHKRNPYALASITVLTLFGYIVGSWHDQTFGGSFGLRVVVDVLPLLALPLALSLQHLHQHRWSWRLAQGGLIVSVGVSMVQMHALWQGQIDLAHPTWAQYTQGLTLLWPQFTGVLWPL